MYSPKSDFKWQLVFVSDLIQIDQMSIKIESSRNITNVSATDPKFRFQMATSVCVYIMYSCLKFEDFITLDCCIPVPNSKNVSGHNVVAMVTKLSAPQQRK